MVTTIEEQELGEALRKCALWTDEMEIFRSEDRLCRAVIDSDGKVSEKREYTGSLALTAKVDGHLGRFSQAFSSCLNFDRFLSEGLTVPPKMAVDSFSYSLNGPKDLPHIVPKQPMESPLDLSENARRLYEILTKEWPDLSLSLSLSHQYEKKFICNSHGLKGSYERNWVNHAFGFFDAVSNQFESIHVKSQDSLEGLLDQCREKLRHINRPLSASHINGGISSLIISPWIVEIICLGIASAVTAGTAEKSEVLECLPEVFCLSEDPLFPGSCNWAPFDDEGTPTSSKVLCEGPEIRSRLDSLASAQRRGGVSSGNGFRRSRFLESSFELTPSIHCTSLMLKAGEATLQDILADHSEAVMLDSVIFPLSKLDEFVDRSVAMCFEGKIFKDSEPVARLVAQRHPGVRRVARPRQSHGSLLDPHTIPLKSGHMTYSGWFPYLFIPRFTWG